MQFYVLIILSSMVYSTNQNKGNKFVRYIKIAAKCLIIEYTDEDLDRIYEQWEENERKEQEDVPVM